MNFIAATSTSYFYSSFSEWLNAINLSEKPGLCAGWLPLSGEVGRGPFYTSQIFTAFFSAAIFASLSF
jgi:hypothetical protein